MGINAETWVVTVHGHCPATESDSMPIAALEPEFENAVSDITSNYASNSSHFVFLQKFPLIPAVVFFHTEVLVCPRTEFSPEDQKFLDDEIGATSDFAEIDKSWWSSRTAKC